MEFNVLIYVAVIVTKVFAGDEHCKSKFGVYESSDFSLHSCSWCYYFLFPHNAFKPNPSDHHLHVTSNGTRFPIGTKIAPDSHNKTSTELICSSLTQGECDLWRMCCQSARDCCRRQLQSRDRYVNNTCKPTWDGYGCWGAGQPGQISQISCPNFIMFSVPTRSALKTCQSDATWLMKGDHDWTDYTPCLNYEELKVSIFVGLFCQGASLVFLLPALAIFVHYRSLISQHRIRLHVNFFTSFIFSGICTILWNTTVTYDRLTNLNMVDTLMYRNSPQCKLLSFLKIYFTSTNYVWMFCEGLYLYRLIVNAFSPPKRLLLFYILGWGIPLIYSSAYAILRVAQADESCWSISFGDKEWIIYTPNLTCLVANIYFLCSILRILLTQLQVHPNEPSNFRKALKATFVLIPLFGVQLVVTIYRPHPYSPSSLYYERFSEMISNSQGFFVALIFCLCNGEVISLMKHSWKRRRNEHDVSTKRANTTTSLNMTNTVVTRYNSEKSSPNRSLISFFKKCNEHTDL